MDMFDYAGMLFGGSRTAPDATTVTATGAGASADGEVGITLDADVTPAEDTGVEGDADQTVIDLPTSPDVDEGDELIVTLVGEGPLKTPVVTANPGSGDRMRALANSAKTVANAAQAVAEAVNQHFWHDTNGAHVTQATQDEWEQEQSGPNSLWNSLGMLFRDGLNNLLAIVTNGIAIYDGNGNEDGNILAKFYTFVQNENQHARVDFFNGKGFIDYDSELNTLCISARDDSTATNHQNTARINLYQSLNNRFSNLEILAGAKGAAPPAFIQLDSRYPDYGPESDPTESTYESTIYAYAGVLDLEVDQINVTAANGENSWSTPAGTVLWSSSGWAMAANVTATLDYPVTSCPSGIVLHWQAYASNATQDYDHVYTFIPKQHVVVSNGKGVVCQLANGGFGFVGTKYVYVSDGSIRGHSGNTGTGTASGITYANNHWVLTQVIAV